MPQGVLPLGQDLLPRQTGTIAFDGTDILSMGPAFRQVLGFMP